MLYSNSKSSSFDEIVLNAEDNSTPKHVKSGCFPPFVAWFMEWMGLWNKENTEYERISIIDNFV